MTRDGKALMHDAGAGLAALTLYLFTLLIPLHMAEASQRSFAAIGYDTLSSGWTACQPGTPAESPDVPGTLKCSLAGWGQFGGVAPDPAATALAAPGVGDGIAYLEPLTDPERAGAASANRPRAPPHSL